ncbi:MAG TPA: PEP-CTERM sorting domain-containing protein [Roseateles sp.]
MNQLKTLAAAAALLVSGLASATTLYAEDFTVSYDETTPGFGWISSQYYYGGVPGGVQGYAVEWSLSSAINVSSAGGVPASVTFAIPDFTIKATTGRVLTGDVISSLGDIVYFLNGANASASIKATGSVSVNGGPAITLPSTPLDQIAITPTYGVFSGNAVFSGGSAFDSFSVSGASITLQASGGSFVGIGAHSQNKLKFDFATQAVPEPETYAMLLAGLGIMGFIARRRQR